MTWQLIETAPKDYSDILVYTVEGGPWVVFWSFARQSWSDGVTDFSWTPTHWMPLPPPPVD